MVSYFVQFDLLVSVEGFVFGFRSAWGPDFPSLVSVWFGHQFYRPQRRTWRVWFFFVLFFPLIGFSIP